MSKDGPEVFMEAGLWTSRGATLHFHLKTVFLTSEGGAVHLSLWLCERFVTSGFLSLLYMII